MCRVTVAIILTFAGFLRAQEPTGGIEGAVLDGIAVPLVGAPVSLIAEPNGTPQESETVGGGTYRFSDLPPGTYELTSGARGFRVIRIEVHIAQGEHLNLPAVSLRVGGSGGDCSSHPEYRRLLPDGATGARLSGTVKFLEPPSIQAPNPQVTACPEVGKCSIQRTDAEGRFSFEVSGGSYTLNVIRDEYYTYSSGSRFDVADGWETVYPVTLGKICLHDCPPPPKDIIYRVCE